MTATPELDTLIPRLRDRAADPGRRSRPPNQRPADPARSAGAVAGPGWPRRDGGRPRGGRLKAQGLDMDVGGPTLAGSLLLAGLVDEVRLFVNPVVLGSGLPFFAGIELPVRLGLLGTRTFSSGVVQLRYRVARD